MLVLRYLKLTYRLNIKHNTLVNTSLAFINTSTKRIKKEKAQLK